MSSFKAVRRVLVLLLLALVGFQLLGPAIGLLNTGNYPQVNSDNRPVLMNNRRLGVSEFVMFAGPDELTVPQGSTANVTLFLWSLNKFFGIVRLSVTPSPNLFASLNPPQVSLNPEKSSASILTVFPSVKLAPGTYSVDVTGTSGSKSLTITVKVNVTLRPDFILSVNPESLEVEVGGSTTATLTVAFQNGPTGPVDLTVVVPDGIRAGLAPSSLEGSGTSILTLTVASTVTPGSYSLRVDIIQGLLTRSNMVSLTVMAPGASRAPVLYTSQTALIIGGSATFFALIVWGFFVAPRRREKSQTKYRYETPKPAQS